MKVVIVSGSHRKESESFRISEFIKNSMKLYTSNVEIIDLSESDIPFWDSGVWAGEEIWKEKWNPLKQKLQQADGFVFVSPEWNGMVPSKLKNLLLLCSDKELGHKAGLIVAVSSSVGGAAPISELRLTGYKNNRICFIPEHLIIRNCTNVLTSKPAQEFLESDTYMRKRIAFTLDVFIKYCGALKSVSVQHDEFPYGM